jgi:hypothetical protein
MLDFSHKNHGKTTTMVDFTTKNGELSIRKWGLPEDPSKTHRKR